ncbi:helix-turn-helix transcriptional regulator [Roseomonas harenae]|uniref:helix-turn-helix transcriptional regulator n=1 Tax=Muricoccus harenae TaxID=2692566 RepID=UPI0013311D3B|nr:LuxR C-terminal-related transcriptional regulator [Roseomonas harenae]
MLDKLCVLFGACAGVLAVKEPRRGWGIQVGVDPDIMRLFYERHAGRNPLDKRTAAAPVGAVMTDQTVMSKAELLRTDFYDECLRPQNMNSLLNLRAARGRSAVADLCLVRDRRLEEFGVADIALLELLAPHLRRAVGVTMRLAEAEADRQVMTEMLERLPWAAFVLDDLGVVRFANAAGTRLLQDGELRIGPGGGLLAPNGAETGRLRQMIGAALPNGRTGRAGHLKLARAPPKSPLLVTAVPLRAAAAATVGLAPIPSVLLLAVSPDMELAPASAEVLRTAFGLTGAEAAVAQHVARGEGLPVVAAALGISPSTARTHLKHAFDKTGTHRQAELAALLARLAPGDGVATLDGGRNGPRDGHSPQAP